MPSVSVIIPVYNAQPFLRQTLDSIRAQIFKDLEVICVDDGSADDSVGIIKSYSEVHLIRRRLNSGLASAPRNDGIRAASGEYIALCDADDLMLPGKIAAQMQLLQTHPQVDFCFTDFVDFNDIGAQLPHVSTCPEFLPFIGSRKPGGSHILQSQPALRILVNENFVGASTMFFRKSLTERVGLFREDLRGSEDIDFVFRAAAAGPIGFVDMIGHRRRLHAANVTRNHARMLTSYSDVLRDRYSIAQDTVERRRLRARISFVYESLAYVLRRDNNVRSSLQMALRAAKWDIFRTSVYSEVLKAAVAGLLPAGVRRHGERI